MTPQDAQLIETRQFEKHDIYTAGVPPIMGKRQRENDKLGNRDRADHHRLCPLHAETAPCSLGRRAEPQTVSTRRPFVEFEISGLLRGDAQGSGRLLQGCAWWSGLRAWLDVGQRNPVLAEPGANRRRGQTFLP